MVSASQVRLYEIVSLPFVHALLWRELATIRERELLLAALYLLDERRRPDIYAAHKLVADKLYLRQDTRLALRVGRCHACGVADYMMVVQQGLCVQGVYEVLVGYSGLRTIDIVDAIGL